MQVEHTKLPDVVLIHPKRFGDTRGFFAETFSRRAYVSADMDPEFVQDNHSLSAKVRTVRGGLHFQAPPRA